MCTTFALIQNRINLYFVILVLFLSSAIWVAPRIVFNSNPDSQVRYHHHQGDGATEVGVLAADQYWSAFGYRVSSFLPCLSFRAGTPESCEVYTHYPAGMYLVSSFLLRTFSIVSTNHALQFTRVVLYCATVLLSAFAFLLLGQSLNFSRLGFCFGAFTLGISRGFWLFADNLFGHGIVFALFGVTAGLLLQKKVSTLALFLVVVFSAFLSVELLPVFYLLMFLRYFFIETKRSKQEAAFLFVLVTIGLVLIFLLRIFQNASFFPGGLAAAVSDWADIIRYRILGQGSSKFQTSGTTEVQLTTSFFKVFLEALFDHQRILVTKLGLLLLWVSPIYLWFLRRHKQSYFLIAFYFLSLEWSFLFVQHSIIHLFTVRYVVWPLAIGIAMVFSMGFPAQLWKSRNTNADISDNCIAGQ